MQTTACYWLTSMSLLVHLSPLLPLNSFPGGYSVRIRDSNTPGRKVGLWGCDFCAFTHANVAKVQAHVQERHLAALRRTWETTATLWQGNESRGDALCSDGSGSAGGVVDSCSLVPQPQTASRRQFRFPPMQFASSEDSGGSVSALEPIVICKIDEEEEEEEKACMRRAGPSFWTEMERRAWTFWSSRGEGFICTGTISWVRKY